MIESWLFACEGWAVGCLSREPQQLRDLRVALGRHLAVLRQAADRSQEWLADHAHYDRSTISHLEAGGHGAPERFWRLADELLGADGCLLAGYRQLEAAREAQQCERHRQALAHHRARAAALRAAALPDGQAHAGTTTFDFHDPGLLGFALGAATVEAVGHGDGREVDWMRRWDFVTAVTGVTLGLGVAPLDLDRLAALLPDAGAEPPGRLGMADVAALEGATAALRRWDFSRGGGLSRDAAVAQLRSVLALRSQACTSQVRARLLVATADLGLLAGWMSYDSALHDDARRLWVVALELARQAEHPAAVDLTVDLLLRMAHQALHVRRPEEAQRLVQLCHGAMAVASQSVSANTASSLATTQAWCHAARGDVAACDRALGQSVELLAVPERAAAAPWSAHVGSAELSARQGHAYLTLAMASGDPRHAARAVPLLRQAVRDFGPGYARARAIFLPGLAGAHALVDDLDVAVDVGGQAVNEITALSSRRAVERLGVLDTVVRGHAAAATFTGLREQIRGALTSARL